MATAPSLQESRRATRDVVSFRAMIDGPAGVRTTALVVNISPLGFMSRTDAALTPGERIAVTLPMIGPRAARVVWALGGRVGGEFIDPIPAESYARLLLAAPNDKPGWSDF
ncbi:MAG TPA: PilZ domain-containing protein [Sphingomonas sp.]|nr:PilZ domain-containing protein [Sphingomonas sp.]